MSNARYIYEKKKGKWAQTPIRDKQENGGKSLWHWLNGQAPTEIS